MVTNTPTFLQRTQSEFTQPTRPGFDTDGLNVWLKVNSNVHDKVSLVAKEEAAITLSKTLSDSGKEQAYAAMAARVAPTFAFVGALLTDANAAYAVLDRALIAPLTAAPKNVNEVVQHLRDQEIRHAIGKDDRNATFLKALEAEDLETVRAILTAPGADWVTPDILERGQDQYAADSNPTVYAKHEALDYLIEHLTSLRDQIVGWLVAYGANRAITLTVIGGN